MTLSITAKWTNEEQTSVKVQGDINAFIPKAHRLWTEYGLDVLETNGEIEDYQTQEELDVITEQEIKDQAQTYLDGTDFLVTREAEGGDACPDEIKDKRAKARLLLDGTNTLPDSDLFDA